MHPMLPWTLAACAAASAASAHAEAIGVSATGFTSQFREEVKASSDTAWKSILQLPRWWNGQHSYSGQAANMSLDAQAGGCWCERWGEGQSVQHGQVVLVMPGRVIRLFANLGPLQDLPVQGVLTLATGTQDGKTMLRLTYRVAGPAEAGLEKLAPVVEQVMAEQYKRLKLLVETGKPE